MDCYSAPEFLKDIKIEAETRKDIDKKLIAASWTIQDKKSLNLYESLGIAAKPSKQTIEPTWT